MLRRSLLTESFKRELRQQFDAEEAELILDQESDAVALAIDLQDWEEEQTSILDAALEEERQQQHALECERANAHGALRLSAEAEAIHTSTELIESEAEQERALDTILADEIAARARKRRRRNTQSEEMEWQARASLEARCADAARLIEEEATAARLADRDQSTEAEMAAAAAEVDETDRAEQAQIELLQLLREIRPRRYLLHAIRVGDTNDVIGCLRGGADARKEVNCCTPVWWAAYYGQADVVRVLAAHGAQLDVPCTGPPPPLPQHQRLNFQLRLGPMTPLTIAAAAGDEAVLRALLQCGAAPDAGTFWDRWPLLAAAMFGHSNLCHILLNAGAEANKKTRDGVGALWLCANYNVHSHRQMLLVKSLVLAGADLIGPHRTPMFSWSPIVTKLCTFGESRSGDESGCRWPRFCCGTYELDRSIRTSITHFPIAYRMLLSNDWIDGHLHGCVQDILLPAHATTVAEVPTYSLSWWSENIGLKWVSRTTDEAAADGTHRTIPDRPDVTTMENMATWISPLVCARRVSPNVTRTDLMRMMHDSRESAGPNGRPPSYAHPDEVNVIELLTQLVTLPRVAQARQRAALAKATHLRLGCTSPSFDLPQCLFESIADFLPGRAPSAVALRMYCWDRRYVSHKLGTVRATRSEQDMSARMLDCQ